MSHILDAVSQAAERGDPSVLIAAVPYARFVGMELQLAPSSPGDSEGDSELWGVMRYAPMLVGNPRGPNLHGGIVGALLESTAIFELLWSRKSLTLPKIINTTIHYLRAGRPVDTYARATIMRLGRRIATTRTEAWQDDPHQPIAVADAQFLIPSTEQ